MSRLAMWGSDDTHDDADDQVDGDPDASSPRGSPVRPRRLGAGPIHACVRGADHRRAGHSRLPVRSPGRARLPVRSAGRSGRRRRPGGLPGGDREHPLAA